MNEYLAMVWAMVLTIISGIIYSLILFGKAWREGEEFSGAKFLRTIIWGALIGVFAYRLQLSMPEAESYMTTFSGGFLVIIVDQLAIIVWKKYGDSILKLFGKEPPAPEPAEPSPPQPEAAPATPPQPPQRGCPLNPPLFGR